MKELQEYVRTIPNFPEEGIMFRDVTTILQDSEGLKLAIDGMQEKIANLEFDIIVGAESRGFLFGMPLAYNLNKAFVPVRKKGKLPFKTIEESYELEYGKNYWLRFKDVTEGGTEAKPNEFNQDYLEIVPASIMSNPAKPEDIY
mgnify:CR=1 FL=1